MTIAIILSLICPHTHCINFRHSKMPLCAVCSTNLIKQLPKTAPLATNQLVYKIKIILKLITYKLCKLPRYPSQLLRLHSCPISRPFIVNNTITRSFITFLLNTPILNNTHSACFSAFILSPPLRGPCNRNSLLVSLVLSRLLA